MGVDWKPNWTSGGKSKVRWITDSSTLTKTTPSPISAVDRRRAFNWSFRPQFKGKGRCSMRPICSLTLKWWLPLQKWRFTCLTRKKFFHLANCWNSFDQKFDAFNGEKNRKFKINLLWLGLKSRAVKLCASLLEIFFIGMTRSHTGKSVGCLNWLSRLVRSSRAKGQQKAFGAKGTLCMSTYLPLFVLHDHDLATHNKARARL